MWQNGRSRNWISLAPMYWSYRIYNFTPQRFKKKKKLWIITTWDAALGTSVSLFHKGHDEIPGKGHFFRMRAARLWKKGARWEERTGYAPNNHYFKKSYYALTSIFFFKSKLKIGLSPCIIAPLRFWMAFFPSRLHCLWIRLGVELVLIFNSR